MLLLLVLVVVLVLDFFIVIFEDEEENEDEDDLHEHRTADSRSYIAPAHWPRGVWRSMAGAQRHGRVARREACLAAPV
jgi:hypothetical protein